MPDERRRGKPPRKHCPGIRDTAQHQGDGWLVARTTHVNPVVVLSYARDVRGKFPHRPQAWLCSQSLANLVDNETGSTDAAGVADGGARTERKYLLKCVLRNTRLCRRCGALPDCATIGEHDRAFGDPARENDSHKVQLLTLMVHRRFADFGKRNPSGRFGQGASLTAQSTPQVTDGCKSLRGLSLRKDRG